MHDSNTTNDPDSHEAGEATANAVTTRNRPTRAEKTNALAVGSLGVGSIVGNRHLTDTSAAEAKRRPEVVLLDEETILLPVADYRPELVVRVVDQLPAPTTIRLLRLPNEETVPVLTRPDEYRGYVVRSAVSDEQVERTTHAFVRAPRGLEPEAEYEFGIDAQMFSDELALLRVSATPVDDE